MAVVLDPRDGNYYSVQTFLDQSGRLRIVPGSKKSLPLQQAGVLPVEPGPKPEVLRRMLAGLVDRKSPDQVRRELADESRTPSPYQETTESVQFTIPMPIPGTAPNFGTEQDVYTFQRPWRACDVFVQTSFAIASPGGITIRIYALVQGLRSLVASGRIGSGQPATQRWVASARGTADRYLVTIQNDNAVAAATPVNVTLIGQDYAENPPPYIGTARVNPTVTDVAEIDLLVGGAQVVGVQASNLTANARWLQIHDTSVAIVAGAAPVLSFALEAVVGKPLHIADVAGMFASERLVSGLAVGISSTGPTFTLGADGDVAWMVWYR